MALPSQTPPLTADPLLGHCCQSCTRTFPHSTWLQSCSCQQSSVPDTASSPHSKGIFLSYHFPLASGISSQVGRSCLTFFLALGIPLRSSPAHRANFLSYLGYPGKQNPCSSLALGTSLLQHSQAPAQLGSGPLLLGAHRASYPTTTGPQCPTISMLGFTGRV